jgi:protein-disulfide isomerase
MTLIRTLALSLALTAAPLTVEVARGETSALTPPQEQAVKDIVKRYLVEHPEVLLDGIKALQAKQDAEQADQAKTTIASLRKQLLHDPRDLVVGNPNGDVTLVEFFDYRCGYCKVSLPGLTALIKGDPNLRVVLKEFPILGPDSVIASRAAIASQAQGKYAAFHDEMMANKGALGKDKIMSLAKEAGLDTTKLQSDMEKPAVDKLIADNHDLAEKLAINGTPAFIIGDTLIPGAVDQQTLSAKVAEARNACSGTC